jgi:L-alanine-DL-glutamate epimerase-like enolase superfamily enzyme
MTATPATVEALDVAAYSVPTEEPESDGTFTWSATGVVCVHARSGATSGLGFTYGPAACGAVVTEVLAPVVVGTDATAVPATWLAMAKAVRNAGRPGVVSMAMAAVDVALWDLHARLAGVALVDLLGRCRDEVPVYGSGGFTSLGEQQLRDQLGGWAADGIGRVKMKIGTGWGTDEGADVHRIATARDAVGPGTELFVDANGAYDRKQAVRVAERMAPFGVSWFEEPVSSDDLEGLAEVRGAVDCDVAAGEYGYHLAYFDHLLAAGAVDVLQADVSRCAGITEWLRVAALAAGRGVALSGHCAQSLHAHPACAAANVRHLEYFADHARVDRLLFDGVLDPDGGALRPDRSRPGTGLALRPDADAYRVAVPGTGR